MASEIKSDKLSPSTGTALQIGDASDTITIPTGATFTITDGLGVAGGGTGLTGFTAGDVLYATGTTTLAKLAKGTAEQVLAMNSGATAPDWGSVDLTVLPTITVAKGGTNLTSFTAGDILYATGSTTLAKLAKGSGEDTLKMNSGATAPEWVTVGAATSDFVKILTVSTSVAATSVSIDNVFSATYSNYRVIMRHIKPATDAQNLYFRWIDNSGGVQTSTDYRSLNAGGEVTSGAQSNAEARGSWNLAYAELTNAGSNISNSGATGGIYYDMMVYSPFSAVVMPFVSGSYTCIGPSPFNVYSGNTGFFYNAVETTQFRGFQLYWSGGGNFQTANSTGGSVTVYGLTE
jgi:hypothetical protein